MNSGEWLDVTSGVSSNKITGSDVRVSGESSKGTLNARGKPGVVLGFGLLDTLDMPLDGLHVLLPDSPESARRIHALKI